MKAISGSCVEDTKYVEDRNQMGVWGLILWEMEQ
jgi:hypothetical protein